jgi:HJR/Mrr/RecB family endonuclease
VNLNSPYEKFTCFDLYRENVRQLKAKGKVQYEFTICPMCTCGLSKNLPGKVCSNLLKAQMRGLSIPIIETYLYTCANCGWWAFHEFLDDRERAWPEMDYFLCGAMKIWNDSILDHAIGTLRDYLAKHDRTADFKALNPQTFELLVAECLKHEFKPCEVRHVGVTGGQGDGGIDIYLIKENEEWLIQVKRRLTDSPEPIQTIRELNGVLLREGKQKGIVVTSAPRFTRNAEAETSIKTTGAYVVKLIDRDGLISIAEKNPVVVPWKYALKHFNKKQFEDRQDLSEELISLLWNQNMRAAYQNYGGNAFVPPGSWLKRR